MTIHSLPPPHPHSAKAKPQKGLALMEVLLVCVLIGVLSMVIFPNMLQKGANKELLDSKEMVLKIFRIAQSSAIIEKGFAGIKQKVRLLVHVDPDYKEGYCTSLMLIQGKKNQWKILQPPMELNPGVFFVLPKEAFLQVMNFEPKKSVEGEGPLWLYYEFDFKGHYTGSLNRLCLRQGKLEEAEGKIYIQYKAKQEAAGIYINPNGFAYDVKI